MCHSDLRSMDQSKWIYGMRQSQHRWMIWTHDKNFGQYISVQTCSNSYSAKRSLQAGRVFQTMPFQTRFQGPAIANSDF